MARVYKSARGKPIDMDKVKLANETVVSVGNMKTNARGDALGAGQAIAAGRNQIMDQVYAVNSAPSGQPAPYSPNDPEHYIEREETIKKVEAQKLQEILPDPIPVSIPVTEAPTTAPRGSLASSVVKSKE